MPVWQRKLAAAMHHTLLLFAFIMPLTGWYFTTAGGKPPQFFSLSLPMPWVIAGAHPALRADIKQIHFFVAYCFIALVLLHTLAALKHHFIDKDSILKRMLP
jgi:cytochrome b561